MGFVRELLLTLNYFNRVNLWSHNLKIELYINLNGFSLKLPHFYVISLLANSEKGEKVREFNIYNVTINLESRKGKNNLKRKSKLENLIFLYTLCPLIV